MPTWVALVPVCSTRLGCVLAQPLVRQPGCPVPQELWCTWAPTIVTDLSAAVKCMDLFMVLGMIFFLTELLFLVIGIYILFYTAGTYSTLWRVMFSLIDLFQNGSMHNFSFSI